MHSVIHNWMTMNKIYRNEVLSFFLTTKDQGHSILLNPWMQLCIKKEQGNRQGYFFEGSSLRMTS